jgi:hypothetical protein
VNAGAGFKLPGRTPTHLYVAPDQHLVLWDDDQIVSKRYWNLCTGKKDFCPELAGNSVLWRSDSQGFVALDGAQNLAVANFTNNLCAGVPAASSVYGVAYSPAGDHLSWLTYSDSEQALWLAAPDGSAPIQIASGSIAGARFSPDGQRILLARSNAAATSSVSLGWLDLTASPPVEKLLAANYGGFSRGGDRRILLVDHWNTQDTSGELALIDVANGTRLVLGRAVTEFAVSGDVDAAGTNLAYAVRSRIAADRDGLWLAALPP